MRRMVAGAVSALTLTTVTAVAANIRVQGKLIGTETRDDVDRLALPSGSR